MNILINSTFYFLMALWVIGFVLFFRACQMARGLKIKKMFLKETFLTGQKAAALVFLTLLTVSYFLKSDYPYFWIIFLAGLVLDFLFYLQPTPRISKIILMTFIIFNIVFALFEILYFFTI